MQRTVGPTDKRHSTELFAAVVLERFHRRLACGADSRWNFRPGGPDTQKGWLPDHASWRPLRAGGRWARRSAGATFGPYLPKA
jgi:hypothetical protein